MTLAFRPDEANPRVSVLLADLGLAPGTVDLAIDDRDEMLAFLVKSHRGDRDRALFQYFQSGESIARSLGQVLRWRFGDPGGPGGPGDLGRIRSLLDFASGYGRVTRFLVRAVPAERVWVADVYAGGVRFQAERFSVHAVVSAIRPEDFACAERFDAILVTSLFTHLPEERFVAWLRALLGRLEPGGLLAFSAHSPEVLPAGVEMPASGFLFVPTSESGSLDTSDYGSTWVTADFVRSALARAAGPGAPGASLHRIERALCNFQDLYLALPEPGADFSSLAFQGEPQLFVERAELDSEGRLELAGWAAVRNGGVREVEVWLNEERLGSAPVDGERGDVAGFFGGPRHVRSGWSCGCRLPAAVSRSAAVLRLRVVDGGGGGHVLWAGSVAELLLAASRLESEQLRGWLRHTEAVLAEERARAAVELRALTDRIAAMRSSRFWKLRNAWFRCKARVGLAAAAEAAEANK
jgi:SAM-dependent methyltransferase